MGLDEAAEKGVFCFLSYVRSCGSQRAPRSLQLPHLGAPGSRGGALRGGGGREAQTALSPHVDGCQPALARQFSEAKQPRGPSQGLAVGSAQVLNPLFSPNRASER